MPPRAISSSNSYSPNGLGESKACEFEAGASSAGSGSKSLKLSAPLSAHREHRPLGTLVAKAAPHSTQRSSALDIMLLSLIEGQNPGNVAKFLVRFCRSSSQGNQVANLIVHIFWSRHRMGNFFAQDFPVPAPQPMHSGLYRRFAHGQFR